MATILEFQRGTRKAKADGAAGARRDGEVVLFPGVRYERWSDAPARERGAGRRHDHLEIEH